jgi:hypothetical protein
MKEVQTLFMKGKNQPITNWLSKDNGFIIAEVRKIIFAFVVDFAVCTLSITPKHHIYTENSWWMIGWARPST